MELSPLVKGSNPLQGTPLGGSWGNKYPVLSLFSLLLLPPIGGTQPENKACTVVWGKAEQYTWIDKWGLPPIPTGLTVISHYNLPLSFSTETSKYYPLCIFHSSHARRGGESKYNLHLKESGIMPLECVPRPLPCTRVSTGFL